MPAAAFDALMGDLDATMLIVTARAGEQRAGCLVGFSTQASIDPPRFLACISDKNRTYRLAAKAERLAVHFIPEGAEALAELFGGETGDEVDKFARCAWRDGPAGLPLLEECPSWFVGDVVERIRLGDHVGFLLEPTHAHHEPAGPGVRFHRAKRIDPGHPA